MFAKLSRRPQHAVRLLLVFAFLASGILGQVCRAIEVDPENVYRALIEPSAGPDGRVTAEQRQRILDAGSRILSPDQLRELDRRIAVRSTTPAHFANSAQSEAPVALPTVSGLDGGTCAAPCGTAPCGAAPCCKDAPETLWDNLSLFAGLDGSKQPQDWGINAHMGGRLAADWGLPIWEEYGLGVQLGVGYNFADPAVAVLKHVDGNDGRTQIFTTTGIFQRCDCGLLWEVAYDYQSEDYYENFDFGQWRGKIGYQLDCSNEVGFWGTLRERGDVAELGGTTAIVSPIDQGNIYWRHTWQHCAETTVWLGAAEGHDGDVLVFTANPHTTHPFIYGADLFIPLNNYCALYGEANFITPADSGTVDAYLGIAFYPGGGAPGARSREGAPVLSVANNTNFAINLHR